MAETLKKTQVMATIDVGAHAVRMLIAEVKSDKSFQVLEDLEQPVPLGANVFSYGKISNKAILMLCEIFQGFRIKMDEYGVDSYRAIATSAVREASNAEVFLERIRHASNIDLQIFQGEDGACLDYLTLTTNVPPEFNFKQRKILVADIGTGACQVSLYDQGMLCCTETIRIGTLRLIEEMEANASNAGMQELLEPFVRKAFEDLEHIAACFKSDAVVAMGSTVRAMAQLGGQVKTNKKTSLLSEKAFMELCDKAKGMETERIVDNYNLSYEMAEAVPPCCMILKYFFNLTGAKELMIPMTSTKDALLLDFINNSFSDKDYFEPQILALADKLADKYHCNYDYTDNVVKFAEKLFRKLEPLHGLDKEDLILLKLAAKLHKIGLFVSNRAYHKLSFFLIEASEIPGISKLQHRIVALTARYHRKAFPKAAHVEYMDLPPEARDCVCKLGALLRLACGLAASYSAQDRLKVKIEAEEVVIRIEGVPEVDDGGYLKKKSKFFEYVYAREVVL